MTSPLIGCFEKCFLVSYGTFPQSKVKTESVTHVNFCMKPSLMSPSMLALIILYMSSAG